VNYTNRNANSPTSSKQLGVAYTSATLSALATAIGAHTGVLNDLQRTRLSPLPPLPSVSSPDVQRHTGRLWKRNNLLTEGGGGGVEEPNHMMVARKPGPLLNIQYSLGINVNFILKILFSYRVHIEYRVPK
jgi:hypothetical protein